MFGEKAPDAARTDDGNALRLVAAHGAVIRYVHEWECFAVWNGSLWERDPHGLRVLHLMRELVRNWYTQALLVEDPAQREAALGWALQCQGIGRLRAAVELAKADPRIHAHAMDFDADDFKLNVRNGVLDLRDFVDRRRGILRLLAHDPKFLCTKICSVAYNPDAQAPTWQAFLESSAGGDTELRHYRRRRRGSYLSGAPDKVFEIAYDEGEDVLRPARKQRQDNLLLKDCQGDGELRQQGRPEGI